jgi:hypothetical protein
MAVARPPMKNSVGQPNRLRIVGAAAGAAAGWAGVCAACGVLTQASACCGAAARQREGRAK